MSDSQESCYHISFPEPRPHLQGTQIFLLHRKNSPEKSDSEVRAVCSLYAKTDVIMKKKTNLNGRKRVSNPVSKIKQFKCRTAQSSGFPWRRSAQRLWAYSTGFCLLQVLGSTHGLTVLLVVCVTWQGKVQQLSHWLERRCSDSSDGTAANGLFNCLEDHISRTAMKIHCITHSLKLVTFEPTWHDTHKEFFINQRWYA